MHCTTLKARTTVAAVAVLIAGGCDRAVDTTAPVSAQHEHSAAVAVLASPNAVLKAGLSKMVRAGAARYNSVQQARKNGYLEDPFCVAVPGVGGMGHHWANPDLIDGTFDPMQPEVVLYAPDKHGKMRLVAVEYIVLKPDPTSTSAPDFDGHTFDDGGTPVGAPHWSLHVWLFEHNPNGMFAPFNPNVTCP
jgi:hypothetical protein